MYWFGLFVVQVTETGLHCQYRELFFMQRIQQILLFWLLASDCLMLFVVRILWVLAKEAKWGSHLYYFLGLFSDI